MTPPPSDIASPSAEILPAEFPDATRPVFHHGFRQLRRLFSCCLFSVAAHLLFVQLIALFGHYDFGKPVGAPPAVTVDLAELSTASPPAEEPAAPDDEEATEDTAQAEPPAADDPAPAPASERTDAPVPAPAQGPASVQAPAPAAAPAEPEKVAAQAPAPRIPEEAPAAKPARQAPAPAKALVVGTTPLKGVGDFIGAKHEKLSYQMMMHGLPIGDAELEAHNEKGITSITLRVKTSPAVSAFYRVDDFIETQQVAGMYIQTKIRQQEGNFASDEMFTINLRKKRVSWFDLVGARSQVTDVPNSEVLDSLSGIYSLRTRPLQVGQNETLQIYDSERYAAVPVEVVRREVITLPNLTRVPTLVVRPLAASGVIFRRTADLMIWMTDDDRKVPVKIETTLPVGRVTARLVSAETEPVIPATPKR
ncbi:hypothetical protein GMSM_27060 [Geomonas sp. Red276]